MTDRGVVGYVDVVRIRGAVRAFMPALVGKLSFAMVSLAMLLLVQQQEDSFAVAGFATGLFGVANVAASPIRARLIDHFGQRRVLNLLAAAYAGSLTLFTVVALAHLSPMLVVVVAGVAGLFVPPIGAAMRVVWSRLAPSDQHKTRAYGLDAVAEEVIFTVGPLVVSAVVIVGAPAVAVLCAAGFGVLGTLGLTSSHASRLHGARREAQKAKTLLGPLSKPQVVPMLLTLLGVGVILGSTEILATAIASRLGNADAAGLLLAGFAAGSAAGGLVYGARAWPGRATHRLILLGTLMCLATGLLLVVAGPLASALVLIAVGVFLAPAMVTGYLLADDLTDEHTRTEASAWVNTAVNAGAAISVAGAGIVIDQFGTATAILSCVTAAALVVILAAPRLAVGGRKQPIGAVTVAEENVG